MRRDLDVLYCGLCYTAYFSLPKNLMPDNQYISRAAVGGGTQISERKDYEIRILVKSSRDSMGVFMLESPLAQQYQQYQRIGLAASIGLQDGPHKWYNRECLRSGL